MFTHIYTTKSIVNLYILSICYIMFYFRNDNNE